MPVQTRASTERGKTDKCFESQSQEIHLLISQDHEEHVQTEINAGSPASISSNDAPKLGTRYCEGCILLKNEIEEIKREIEELKKFNIPAQSHSTGSSDFMQIKQCLDRNNSSVISAIQALGQQLSKQGFIPGQPASTSLNTRPISTRHNDTAEKSNQTSSESAGNRQGKQRKKKKKNSNSSPNENNPAPSSSNTATTPDSINEPTSVPATPIPASSQPDRKETVVIAGDSLVKNIIGAKMSYNDPNNYFVVKPFPGATVEDMEDYIKPLTRKSPDKLIMHVGTNDLKSLSPKSIADSLLNLATQVKQDSPNTRVGISSLLVRNDSDALLAKAKQVNVLLNEYCIRNKLAFLDNSNISTKHLNSKGLHLNKHGSWVLQENLRKFANNVSN